jgi:NADH-quinone oxidoreductase subunit M
MDTYTAAEFIYTEELYHYSYRFYAPVVRLYENHPKITNLYIALVQRITDLGNFVKYWVFSIVPGRGVLLLTLTLILLLWGETL